MKKDELMKSVIEKKIELTKLIGRINTGKEKNVKKPKMLRREIAQIMTKINTKI